MEAEQPLSLYVAEFLAPWDDAYKKQRYHTALLLRNEYDPEPGILYQLHYNGLKANIEDELFDELTTVPNIRYGMRHRTFIKLAKRAKVDEGYEFETRQKWNHILREAIKTRSKKPKFDYKNRHLITANNCRSGVISALSSIGIAFDQAHYMDDAGTQCTTLPLSNTFELVSAPEDPFEAMIALHDLREETKKLTKQLPVPQASTIVAGALDHVRE